MIASWVVAAAFGRGCAPEFSAPDHQRVLQQTPLFQIRQQPGDGPIHLGGLFFMVALQVAMSVPPALDQLDEAHAAFDQAARQQTIPWQTTLIPAPEVTSTPTNQSPGPSAAAFRGGA